MMEVLMCSKKNNFTEKMQKMFKKVGKFLDNSLFPTDMKCAFCERDVPDFENHPFCEECEKDIAFNNGNRCLICSEPIDNEAVVCDYCQKHKRSFKKAVCPFVYSGKVRDSILAFKDSNKRYLSKVFAKYIAEQLKVEGVEFNRISFVPLTDKKKRKRGFDQAELLAKELGELVGVKPEKMFIKIKDGKSQKFSSFKERHENMIGTYKLCDDIKFKADDVVLIVDDIITTGATIDACAMLCEKKVKAVYVAAVARNKLKEKVDVK